jgi:integrase
MISSPEYNLAVWKPAYAVAGLDYTPRRDDMHGMRHFYASVALASGVSVKELAEYLGHHDPGYTLRIYAHLPSPGAGGSRRDLQAAPRRGGTA